MSSLIMFALMIGVFVLMNKAAKKRRSMEHKKNIIARRKAKYQQEANLTASGITGWLLIEQISRNQELDEAVIDQMRTMELSQLQNFMLEQDFVAQQQLNEILTNSHQLGLQPGMDLITDEMVFGIDHQLGIVNPEHNFSFDNHNFGNDHHFQHDNHNQHDHSNHHSNF